jgi:hypothetical protein
MIVRTDKKDKKGNRIYKNVLHNEDVILPRYSGVGGHGRLHEIARQYLHPAPSAFERKMLRSRF